MAASAEALKKALWRGDDVQMVHRTGQVHRLNRVSWSSWERGVGDPPKGPGRRNKLVIHAAAPTDPLTWSDC